MRERERDPVEAMDVVQAVRNTVAVARMCVVIDHQEIRNMIAVLAVGVAR